MTDKACEVCKGTGWVCENHMDTPWGTAPEQCDLYLELSQIATAKTAKEIALFEGRRSRPARKHS